MHRRRPTQFRRGKIRMWGFTVSQALIGLAILVLAASVFLPAFKAQCAAAKMALRQTSNTLTTAR